MNNQLKNPTLFLGVPLDKELAQTLELLPKTFAQGETYLSKVQFQDRTFLAKPIGEKADLETLHLLEVHLISVFKKLLPHFSVEAESLLLFAKQD